MIICKQYLILLLRVESPFLRMNDKFPCYPCDVMNCMKKYHGANVSHHKTWRGHGIALNSIRGIL